MASRALLFGSCIATALGVVAAASLAIAGRPPSHVVVALAIAFVPYALLFSVEPPDVRFATRLALALAAIAGLACVVAPSVLSDDLYRYLWDGRVLRAGLDPYRYAPDHPALAHLRDAYWARINFPEIPTIYPPLAQALFALCGAIAHAPWSIKLAALIAHLATIPIVGRLAGERAPRAVLLYGLNPLAISEAALGGHVDAVVALAIAGFVVALASARPMRAALLAAAACALKVVGLAVAPLLLRDRRRYAALAIALCAVALSPLPFAGGGEATAGLGHYARRWRGNEGGFLVVESAARIAVDAVAARTGSAPDHVRLPFLTGVLRAVEGSPLDPRAAILAEKKDVPDVADFQSAYVASMLARVFVVALVLGLAIWLGRRGTDPLLATRTVLLFALLLAPQIHPWYLLWLLPLEAAAGRATGLVWSAAVLVAYAPLDRWVEAREWAPSTAAIVAQHLLVVGVLTAESALLGKIAQARPVDVGQPCTQPTYNRR